MATNYELYLGGPRQQNTDWAIFPAAPFNAANVSNLGPPSKHPVVFAASRTFDFVNDAALKYFLKKNVTLPMIVGDALGAVVVPANSLFLGCWYKVVAPVAGATGTFNLKFRTAGQVLNAAPIALNAVSSGFGVYNPAGAITTGATFLTSALHYFAAPDILDLVLVAVPTPATLAGLIITVTPVYYNFQSGQMN
jgi:hypothetical protein